MGFFNQGGASTPRSAIIRSPRRLVSRLFLAVVAAIGATAGILQTVHAAQIARYDVLPVCRVRTDKPVVAFTFDDGPDPAYTPAVLALLNRYGSRATFFLVGKRAAALPELVRREAQAGMEIANLTWAHPHLGALTSEAALGQVRRTEVALSQYGVPSDLFRAPYGEIGPEQLAGIVGSGLRPIQWSVALDSYVGGMGLEPEQAAAVMARDIQPGDIILAHDARIGPQDGGTERASAMAALRLLLPALQERELTVTTVGRLLSEGAPVLARPRIWFWQSGFTCPGPS